jgi:APA family basic amino acid/polyamine antiporter
MRPDPQTPAERPPASLSAFDIGCIVVGGIIGVGIFFTPAKVAERAGSPGLMMATWAIGGCLALLGALVFAELSVRVPGHGGMFRYIHAAFGRLPAFLYGWSNWLVIQAGALSIVGLLCVVHIEEACYGTRQAGALLQVVLAGGLIVGFTLTNLFGLRVGKQVQNALTVGKVLALCLLIVAAVLAVAPAAAAGAASSDAVGAFVAGPPADGADGPAVVSPWLRIAGALLPVLFATGGWQQGSFVAGAARGPRSVPIGILLGVVTVVVVYMAINLAYLRLLPFEVAAASPAIGADAAEVALGSVGKRVYAAMVAVSALGIMNTICMAPPYVLMSMAEQQLFPAAFARRHPRYGTPVLAVVGQGTWAVVLLSMAYVFSAWSASSAEPKTIDTLGFLCDGVVFVDWCFFTLCGAALLRLRSEDPQRLHGRWRGVVALTFALAAALVTVGALATYSTPSLAGGALAALGLVGYRLLVPRHP